MNLKKLVKELNEYVAASNWSSKQTLRAELTQFETGHRVSSGRNGVSTLLDLRTTVMELESLLIEGSNYLSIYLNVPVKETQGWGLRQKGTFIKIRLSSGKYETRDLHTGLKFSNGEGREDVNTIISLLKYPDLSNMDIEAFEQFKANKLEDFKEQSNVRRIGQESINEAPSDKELRHEFTFKTIENAMYDLHRGETEVFEEILSYVGAKLSKVFPYTDKIWCRPEFINETRNGFEVGFRTNDTYNSLPCVLKIEKTKEIKTVSLKELGIETAGYYSHHDRMQILPEQVDVAKKFAKQFESKKIKKIQDVLKKIA